MYERLTERATQAVEVAGEEARRLRHAEVDPEHLLLGLVRTEEAHAWRLTEERGVRAAAVEAALSSIAPGEAEIEGAVPVSPRGKRVLELALTEAVGTGQSQVGTEHLLIALAQEDDGLAARVLRDLGLDADVLRGALLRVPRPSATPSPVRAQAVRASARKSADVGRGPRPESFAFVAYAVGAGLAAGVFVVVGTARCEASLLSENAWLGLTFASAALIGTGTGLKRGDIVRGVTSSIGTLALLWIAGVAVWASGCPA